ncbi:uncharacterized protein DSM5745_10663 [Aspergillus mulundensis]|uniref:Uncharacterized protein n=1 Tax=Aspergillus mulundensis TaxID=1810919 RepID=A0A3D8QH83_9EURO|nr:hypothetical protein DSM5745_10663 [Aspergillus mulundensis]RDW61165.1 hypothetical protein DSM5745_10663 [Aspergillus mulundensis]
MASQQKAAGLPSKPPQGIPRPLRPLQHKLPSSIHQRTFPQLQRVSHDRVELGNGSNVPSTRPGCRCPRCGSPRGHRPGCADFNIANERKEHKELERKKAIKQNQYEASRGAGLNVPVSAADAPYGLAIYPPGSAPPPPSAWPAAVIDLTDDTPATFASSFLNTEPALSRIRQNTSAAEAPLSATVSSSNENHQPLFPPRRSEDDASSAPYSPPAAIPHSSPTSYQPTSATSAGTPALFGHRDTFPFTLAARHRSPFDLSSGLPSPDDSFASFTEPATFAAGRVFRLEPRRFSQTPTQRLSLVDRRPALAPFASQTFSRQHVPVTIGPRAEAPASGPSRMPTSTSDPRLNTNGKRSFGDSFENDSLFVSPSPTEPRPLFDLPPTPPRAGPPGALERAKDTPDANANSYRPSLSQPTGTGRRVCLFTNTSAKRTGMPTPPAAMNTAPPAPAWPASTSVSTSTSATSSGIPAFTSAVPASSHPAPPVLPRPVPGYVWIGSGWHGPVWTCALPAHMGGNPGDIRARADGGDQIASAKKKRKGSFFELADATDESESEGGVSSEEPVASPKKVVRLKLNPRPRPPRESFR